MHSKYLAAIIIALTILIFSCSRKHAPQQTADITVSNSSNTEIKKIVVKKRAVAPVARVIVVNDNVAKKNIDGRLYYDVGGHRYWRNYNDGKYYLFNKSMYTDSAFKPH